VEIIELFYLRFKRLHGPGWEICLLRAWKTHLAALGAWEWPLYLMVFSVVRINGTHCTAPTVHAFIVTSGVNRQGARLS
jgi:hypothetical protein